MERYDKYKDSGVEWIGEIPEGWEVKKLARTVEKLTNGYVGPTRNIMRSAGIPYIQGIHIKNNTVRFTPTGNYYVDREWSDTHKKSILKTNDLLVVQTGTIGDVGIVPEEFEGANCHALLIVRSNKSVLFSKYFLYFLTSPLGYTSLQLIKTGEILFHINGSKLKGIDVIIPSLPEQAAIANYLDRKTAEIDQLITQKEDLLCLYEEEKTTIINQAVTQGINPDVKLKESGIDWLGDIPEHWEVKKLKYVTKIISKGTTPSTIGKSTTSNGDVRFIKAENISNNDVVSEPSNYIDDATDDILKRSQLLTNDILFVIAGATIGKVAILKKEFTPANTNQAVSFIRLHNPKSVKFIWYWLQSNKIYGILWLDAVQSAQPNLSMENLGNFYVPFPESSEQTAIVHHIETQATRINAKITKTKKIIALQKEYRTALISEVVTGKIKVTQEVAL